jgi:signal transduction histidine kinase
LVSDLRKLLVARHDDILVRWSSSRRGLVPEPLAHAELLDHMPRFLDEVVTALEEALEVPSAEKIVGGSAAKHGTQRFRLGFELDAVVREYGTLFQAIVEEARDAGITILPREAKVLGEAVVTGIAEAVTQYSAQRDAEQRRQANEHFGFLAHELRNPLAAARLALESLESEGLLPRHRLVGMLAGVLTRMTDLINQALSIALLGSGAEQLRERICLGALVRETVSEHEGLAKQKGIALEVEPGEGPALEGDPRLLRSMLTNLIGNAVKFTRPEGSVSIRSYRTDQTVSIEVADQCGGLPPGKTSEMFASFAQIGTDRRGYGLGLAIAKQSAEAHGGSVRVRNIPGTGCVFTVELPAAVS